MRTFSYLAEVGRIPWCQGWQGNHFLWAVWHCCTLQLQNLKNSILLSDKICESWVLLGQRATPFIILQRQSHATYTFMEWWLLLFTYWSSCVRCACILMCVSQHQSLQISGKLALLLFFKHFLFKKKQLFLWFLGNLAVWFSHWQGHN